MAYATVDDLERTWRTLSETERGQAAALLENAAAVLDAEMARCGVAPDETRLKLLEIVSCNMVRRAMASGVYGDFSSISRTAGSFTEQITPSNPSGDMYLTANERRLLGVGLRRGRIAQVGPC